MGTDLEEPIQINAMRSRQVAQRHAASLLHELYHRLVVSGDDQEGSLLGPPRVCEIFGGVEGLTVLIHLTVCGGDGRRFRFLRRGR